MIYHDLKWFDIISCFRKKSLFLSLQPIKKTFYHFKKNIFHLFSKKSNSKKPTYPSKKSLQPNPIKKASNQKKQIQPTQTWTGVESEIAGACSVLGIGFYEGQPLVFLLFAFGFDCFCLKPVPGLGFGLESYLLALCLVLSLIAAGKWLCPCLVLGNWLKGWNRLKMLSPMFDL